MGSVVAIPKKRRSFPKILFGVAMFVMMLALTFVYRAPALPPIIRINPPPPAPIHQGVFIVRAVVTLAVMTAALWVIVSKRYPPADRKWAYGAIAAIMGFWLAVGKL